MLRQFLFILVCILFPGCGSEREVEPKQPSPGPLPIPSPGTGAASFSDVQKITTASCLRCHGSSQFLKTEAGWRASEAAERVSKGEMPPPGTPEARNISAADKKTLITF